MKYKGVESTAQVKLACLLAVIGVVFAYVGLTFKADAKVALFLSGTSSALEETLLESPEEGEKSIQHERRWSNFTGSVPEESSVENIVLRLAWSVGVVRNVPATDLAPIENHSEVASSTVADEENTVIEPQAVEEPLAEVGTTSVSEETIPEENAAGDIGVLDEQKGEPSAPEEVPPTSEDTSGVEIELISADTAFSLATAQNTEDIVVPEEFFPESVAVDSFLASSTSPNSDTSSSSNVVAEDTLLEVLYSLDGEVWHSIGTVTYTAVGEAQFDVSHIGFELIPQLHIAARYKTSTETPVSIHFDTVQLEVGLSELLVEEVPVLEEMVSDQEPNFSISSVKADVRSENIRAVVIEKGGILEFWYWTIDTKLDEGVWRRLAGGSAVDSTAPIAIKEGTIFWLDGNQQTLFGFSVDTQLLSGVSFDNPEDKVFLLPFEGDGTGTWHAIFDPELSTFNFEKVRNSSS